jgi:hypothetical protein
MTPDSPSMAASTWGTIPSVHPDAASTPRRQPPAIALDTVYSTPVPGTTATTSEVSRNSTDTPPARDPTSHTDGNAATSATASAARRAEAPAPARPTRVASARQRSTVAHRTRSTATPSEDGPRPSSAASSSVPTSSRSFRSRHSAGNRRRSRR